MSFVIWSRFFRSTLFVLRLRGRRDICRWRLRSSFILYEFGLVCLFHPTWSFELLHQTDAFRCFVSVWRMSFTPCVTSTAPSMTDRYPSRLPALPQSKQKKNTHQINVFRLEWMPKTNTTKSNQPNDQHNDPVAPVGNETFVNFQTRRRGHCDSRREGQVPGDQRAASSSPWIPNHQFQVLCAGGSLTSFARCHSLHSILDLLRC